MYYLRFFVHCDGWVTGGYENAQYFETARDAIMWAHEKNVSILEIRKVSNREFAEDYIFTL